MAWPATRRPRRRCRRSQRAVPDQATTKPSPLMVEPSWCPSTPMLLNNRRSSQPRRRFRANPFSAAMAWRVGKISFPRQPKFYARFTADGIPYWKIAVLHSADVLATTVLQNCIRYQNRTTTCQFCAIGQSLKKRSHNRPQNTGTTLRSRKGRGRTRQRQTHGADHRHAQSNRPRSIGASR